MNNSLRCNRAPSIDISASKMHLSMLLSLLSSYFGSQNQSQTVFVYDCMKTSGKLFHPFVSARLANANFLFVADNVKLMMQSSLFGFRLSIVQLNDANNDLNVNQIIQTMLLTTHNVCPVGILFNYDCPYSKSFVSAVSEDPLNLRIFKKVQKTLC